MVIIECIVGHVRVDQPDLNFIDAGICPYCEANLLSVELKKVTKERDELQKKLTDIKIAVAKFEGFLKAYGIG